MQMSPGQPWHTPPQPPPQAQRNDCSECYVGRPHMHDGSSSDNGNSARIMAGSDPANAYACGPATGIGFVGARQNDGTLYLVDGNWHIIMRRTHYGITTFTDTGLLSNAQPGSSSRHFAALVDSRTPTAAGRVPVSAPGGQVDPRRCPGTSTQPQPDSRHARGLHGLARVHMWRPNA